MRLYGWYGKKKHLPKEWSYPYISRENQYYVKIKGNNIGELQDFNIPHLEQIATLYRESRFRKKNRSAIDAIHVITQII